MSRFLQGPQPSSGVNGNMQPPGTAGQQPPASTIPFPEHQQAMAQQVHECQAQCHLHHAHREAGKPSHPSPTPSADRLEAPCLRGVKNSSLRTEIHAWEIQAGQCPDCFTPPQSASSGPSDGVKEDDAFSESGEMEGLNSGLNSGGSTNSSPKVSPRN